MTYDYDVIIIGVGGMGAATAYSLARRGVSVCGIERHGVAHDLGSSHGHTRIIRKAYFEHPDYIPLLHRSYELWAELAAQAKIPLFDQCGFLTCGLPDSESIKGLEASYAAHGVTHERLGYSEVRDRFPQFLIDRRAVGFLDPFGGYLRVEDCVEQHILQAEAAGAELFFQEPVVSWEACNEGVVVGTASREATARSLVLTTGAWAAPELTGLGIPTEVWRKVLFWYETAGAEQFLPDCFPTFYVETDSGHFYGFPSVDDKGLKVAEHFARTPIDNPGVLDRDLLPDDEPPVRHFVRQTFPEVVGGRTGHVVCMYTVTPDQHFVVARHPVHPQVVIGAGFSGHGYKFAPVVGEVLGDLAVKGATVWPVEFLGIHRFDNRHV